MNPESPAGAGHPGLTAAQATERLLRDGPNELPEPKRSAWRELASHFWSPIPWMIESAAVLGTQLIATLFAVQGWFMRPIALEWAAGVWLYSPAWFFVNDRVKIAAVRIFNPRGKPGLLQTKIPLQWAAEPDQRP